MRTILLGLLVPWVSFGLVGGQPVEPGGFPSVFVFTTEDADLTDSYCTATKISEKRFLTGAHCVLEQVPTKKMYRGPWIRPDSTTAGNILRISFSRDLKKSLGEEFGTIAKVFLPRNVRRCLKNPKSKSIRCRFRTPLPDWAIVEWNEAPKSFVKAPTSELSKDKYPARTEVTVMGYGMEAKIVTRPPRLKFIETRISSKKEVIESLKQTYAEKDGLPFFRFSFGIASDPKKKGHFNLGGGDSGGPVFLKGTNTVIAVNSDGYCPIGDRECGETTNSIFGWLK